MDLLKRYELRFIVHYDRLPKDHPLLALYNAGFRIAISWVSTDSNVAVGKIITVDRWENKERDCFIDICFEHNERDIYAEISENENNLVFVPSLMEPMDLYFIMDALDFNGPPSFEDFLYNQTEATREALIYHCDYFGKTKNGK